MELPIGLVMKENGAKLPTTHLIDPIASLRAMRIANFTLPLLLRRELKLRKKYQNAAQAKTRQSFQANPDLRVY
jgi:hypothetical protein